MLLRDVQALPTGSWSGHSALNHRAYHPIVSLYQSLAKISGIDAMQPQAPSRTARAAATHRAAHQILEQGRIFADPLAVRILGEEVADIAAAAAADPSRRGMRLFIAARTRFAEDALALAVAQGARQLVVLGAGLDTYAYRNPFGAALRVFEVDHPATQAWKRARLAEAGIAVPDSLVFAPVDFESVGLAQGLAAAGFDEAVPSFFTWLGVVPYLTEAAVFVTLRYVGGLPGGAATVFDYADPPETLSPEQRAAHDARAARVAGIGEAWLSYFDAATLHRRLLEYGFTDIEDLGPPAIYPRYFRREAAEAPARGGHFLRAATGGR
jgi:methyltransferase (TIGR00027 family)